MLDCELFPPFVNDLPEVGLEVPGLSGRVLRGHRGLVIFMQADSDVVVPRHHHGDQWGVVLSGRMDLTIAGETETYERGDSHFIPAGVDHEATVYAGWRGLYVFSR